jgi:beta-mannosidase
MDLNGENWWLGQAPADSLAESAAWNELERVDEWLPAIVPGNVRADLVRTGRLPDLALGVQVERAQWVDQHCWWLTRDFSLAISPAERAHLVLRGVDYVSDLYLNGHHLGRHEGMFSPQMHDVSGLLQAENRLAIRVWASQWLPEGRSSRWERLLNLVESKSSSLSQGFPQRRDVLKCQMGFGWDFAPPLRTMGVWDDVYVILSGDVLIRHTAVRQRLTKDGVSLVVRVELDARQGRSAHLRCTLAGETFESALAGGQLLLELPPGSSLHTLEFTVPQPRLWWPWDHGTPALYRLTIDVCDGEQLLDSRTQMVGLRSVELQGWTLYINGRPVYARGANWVPADILPGRVRGEDYQTLLELVRRANMNMLRVWGGGLREKRAFYDLCDRMGILVWQEFPFACAFVARYPRSPEYLRLVRAETRAIARDLLNHPCLAIWCGGNEFSPARNVPLVSTLEQVVRDEDPTRPFLPASPAGGDSHNWQVWHDFEPPSAYRADQAGFASEFGLQAPPDVDTLRRFIPREELWPPSKSWVTHGANLKKLRRYARPFLDQKEPSLDAFVRASQRAQAHGLQIAIEHYRRRKAQGCGGVLLWQFNEPWPAISWAIVDSYRRPKPAYETVKRLYEPLLLSADYPLRRFKEGERFEAQLWIVNDQADSLPGCQWEAVLRNGSGQEAYRAVHPVDVPPFSAEIAGCVSWNLPAGGGWALQCQLRQGTRLLVENWYDLTVHDDIRQTARQRLWAWLTGLVLPS